MADILVLVAPTPAQVRALAQQADAEIISMVREFDTLDTASIPNPIGTAGALSVVTHGFVAIAERRNVVNETEE